MDVATVEWLASPGGQAALAQLPPYAEADAIGLVARLRASGVDAERASALVTQQRLRSRAAAKFGAAAARMLFTSDGLEQATRPELASAHADRYAAAGLPLVHDLGCGIGSDAMALAATGAEVVAVDADPVTAAVASANLRRWPSARAEVAWVEEVLAGLSATDGAWLDPARRESGVRDATGRARRIHRLEELSPPWETVLRIAAATPATGVKLGPSFPHDRIPVGAEAQWTSFDGELLECALWWGPLARNPGRSALVMRTGAAAVEVTEEQVAAEPPVVRGLADLEDWLYETDRAVTQAGLVGIVTEAVGGGELSAGVGLISSAVEADVAVARRWRVEEAMPFSPKGLRAWLRARGVGALTIKSRGIRIDGERLRRELKVRDGDEAVVLRTPVAGRACALALDR